MNKYEQHKPSGVEWIGNIPCHWELRKISRSFKIIGSGTTPDTGNDEYYTNGTIPWINTGDLNDGLLVHTAKCIAPKAVEDLSALKIFPNGSLIVAMYGATIGKVALTGIDACVNQACCVLNKSEFFLQKFLYYWFLVNKPNIINLSYGGGQPNISQDIVRTLKIPCPPEPEQTAILNFLDRKVDAIENCVLKKRQLIDLLHEEKAALINHTVTKGIDDTAPMKPSGIEWLGDMPAHWEAKKLKYIVDKIDLPTEETSFVVAVENIESFTGKLVYEEQQKTYQGQMFGFEKGDVLFNKLRPYLTKVYLAERGGSMYGELLILRAKELMTFFLYFRLLSYDFIQEVNSSTEGSKMPRANWEDFIKHLEVPIPPTREQEVIVKHLQAEHKKIDKLISKIEKEIDLLKEYKTALIYEVVTGKVKVDAPALQPRKAVV